MTNPKRLTRSREKMVAGVLAGIANYFDTDPTIVRIAYVVLSIASVIMWIIIPEEKLY